MCRLLGYATAGFNVSLNAILGSENAADFRELSEIHNDGWGVAQLSDPAEAPYIRDGGAPTPETGTKIYKSTIAARFDSTFEALANEPARGALWHLRLASSNLPLIMENQHPFYANGLSFIHNGDISDANGRNIVTNRSYPVDHSILLSTGGRSDSAIFFAVILEYIGFGFPLDEAVAQAVRELRQAYPKSSYNCMIQSEDQLVALRASGREVTSPRIVEIYDEYGRGEQAADYRVMRYRALQDENGDPAGVVVSSSGYDQEDWDVLENDQMIVASNRNGTFRLRSI
ncbi:MULTISPECIES: class II glutamine amidotransferase [Bifidobacterium]|uniref:class II glutamine amidotransferase n=1 Tax=Bifidobacterium TaxID=1678 RepID=UPI001BDCB440|nr:MULTISPECIES: class II glutamine amidotransferase [Bifidobacterium]MBT1171508.1 class II glutamine amidotransferase [Bifidobacterium sp. SO4]MBW3091175.1 class II glutamine amidotransferase [Bifidobacterium miconisargentati]